MSKQESVWVQYVREHYEPASDVEMSYEDENNLLWLLNAPAGYQVEDEMLEYAQKHPDASMKNLSNTSMKLPRTGLLRATMG